jgi:hypothetical protein
MQLSQTLQNQNHATEKLYHKDIGFPDDLELPAGFHPIMTLRYGSHANEEALKDRYGPIRLPQRIDVRKGTTIEVGVRDDRIISKMVIRFDYDAEKDIVMVINPKDGFVRTVWFNMKSDQHKTLDRSKYADPNARKQIRH